MAFYFKQRFKLGKNSSIVHVRKLDGKPLLKLLLSPVLLLIWLFTGAAMLLIKLWEWNPMITKYVLAGLFIIGGISSGAKTGTLWGFMACVGCAALFVLWAQFDREKKNVSKMDTSEEENV